MKQLNQLNAVIKLAHLKEQQALARLLAAKQQVAVAQQQKRQLQQFKYDYQHQLVSKGNAGMPMNNLQHWQAFLVKLDQALSQQQRQVDAYQQTLQQQQRQWQQAKRYHDNLLKMFNKRQQALQLARDQSEQKLLDELAQQYFLQTHRSDE
ncbi:MAG: flagellar export protein FliJ [Gammaproteobacteria bacterium]